mgnify:CR=1 FL=1
MELHGVVIAIALTFTLNMIIYRLRHVHRLKAYGPILHLINKSGHIWEIPLGLVPEYEREKLLEKLQEIPQRKVRKTTSYSAIGITIEAVVTFIMLLIIFSFLFSYCRPS